MPSFLKGLTDADTVVPIVVLMALALKFGVVAAGPNAPEFVRYKPAA